VKDNRDPRALGAALLNERDAVLADRDRGAGIGAIDDRPAILVAADLLNRYLVPDYPGDEGPLERYGDPRARHDGAPPIERLGAGPADDMVIVHDSACNDYTGCNDGCMSWPQRDAEWRMGAWRKRG
jgi:hypothetical protein